MSVLRPLLSRRGRLVIAAVALLVMSALVIAPSVSGAKPNSVKQFIASIDPANATGGVAGTWTETVTNCGGPELPARCTLASTIGLGSIRITVPTEFRPISNLSDNNPNWTTTYAPATGNITSFPTSGSFKLQPGESISITFDATPSSCATGAKQFTTAAWGSTTISGTDPFAIQSDQPTVTVATNGACLTSGGSVTGPGGQTETIEGDFQGHVNVTFGSDLSCAFDPVFGAQWSQFNLPTPVNLVPADDFVGGSSPKISTSSFPTEGADSSLYLICYAVPKADHPTAFTTRGGGPATTQTVDGVESWVGILPNCYNPDTGTTRPEPCVSEQFLDVTTNPDRIVISIRVPPTDPHKS